MFQEFISQYGTTIIYAILVALAGFFGAQLKKLYEKYVNDAQKRKIVKSCVKAVRQMYTDLDGQAKLEKCTEAAAEWLTTAGIPYTAIELRLLIEDVCDSFNNGFTGDEDTETVSTEAV